MKTILKYTLIAALAACASSCFGIDDENYPELSPITITVPSDVINANLGETLVYDRMQVSSDLPVTYEWSYGSPQKDTRIEDHRFTGEIKTISDTPTIDYAFTRIGSYILRLKVDNGESIVYKYFTLNVNSGYDEGIVILCDDDGGNGTLAFIKTLGEEDLEAGVQQVYPDIFAGLNPDYKLQKGTDLFISRQTVSGTDFNGFLIATDDADGTLYHLEAKTMEMYAVTKIRSQFGTWCQAFGGEYAATGGFASFFMGGNGRVYRYDMQFGNMTLMDDIPGKVLRPIATNNRTNANSATAREPLFFNADSLLFRKSSYNGVKVSSENGWQIVNVGVRRTGSTGPFYVLMQDKADPSSYKIMWQNTSFTASGWKMSTSFKTDDLKMDRNSKVINTKSSNDVYYTYDNAIWRWGLTTAPATTPSITLPDGEQICDIAANSKGKEKGLEDEDLLIVATYNPSRSGKKGSVYVYNFSDHSLAASYEGICDRPVSVIYKYRIN